MKRNTLFATLFAAATFLPTLAFADYYSAPPAGQPTYQQQQVEQPRYRGGNADGRYELRSVQKWIPGSYSQVWVPQTCHERGRHHRRTVCRGGFYDKQWVAGHYETVQDWVWVKYDRPHRRHRHQRDQVSVQLPGFGVTFAGRF
jgi:hypothetical protein